MKISILLVCVLFWQNSLQSQTPYVSNEARCITLLHKQLDTALIALCGYEEIESLSSDSIVISYLLMLGREGEVDSMQILGSRNLDVYEKSSVVNYMKRQKIICLLDDSFLNNRNLYVLKLRYISHRRRLK